MASLKVKTKNYVQQRTNYLAGLFSFVREEEGHKNFIVAIEN